MDKRDKLIKSLKVSLDVAGREISRLKKENLELDKIKLENKAKLKEVKLLLRLTNDQRRKLKELKEIDIGQMQRLLKRSGKEAIHLQNEIDELMGSNDKQRIIYLQDKVRLLKKKLKQRA